MTDLNPTRRRRVLALVAATAAALVMLTLVLAWLGFAARLAKVAQTRAIGAGG